MMIQSFERMLRVANAAATRVQRRAALRGVFATRTPQHMLRSLAPDYVVDVGANRGQFALDVRRARPAAQIIAFEPLPSEAERFEQIFRGDQRTELVRAGLGSRSGEMEINLSRAADSSSFLEISDAQTAYFPKTDRVAGMMVPILRLDEYVDRSDIPGGSMLKLDVQGFEIDVLEGAAGVLSSFSWIYTEVSFKEFYVNQPLAADLNRFLAERSFHLQSVHSLQIKHGEPLQADFLYQKDPQLVSS